MEMFKQISAWVGNHQDLWAVYLSHNMTVWHFICISALLFAQSFFVTCIILSLRTNWIEEVILPTTMVLSVISTVALWILLAAPFIVVPFVIFSLVLAEIVEIVIAILFLCATMTITKVRKLVKQQN